MSYLFTLVRQSTGISASSISHPNEYSRLISFRIDLFDLLALQDTFQSLLQHHNLKASILWHSVFFMIQLSHLYMTTGKLYGLCQYSGDISVCVCVYIYIYIYIYREREREYFSHSVVSNSLRSHALQDSRLPCPSPIPGACSNSCPSSWISLQSKGLLRVFSNTMVKKHQFFGAQLSL